MSNEEWDRRILCSDGNCIGIVGPDGRCKTCGKPYEGELPLPAADSEAAVDDIGSDSGDVEPDTEQADAPIDAEPADDSDSPSDDDWENRTLCIDESCIGVVGPDGRCKECGKPYPKK